MPLIQTLRDRALSVWQSAANQATATVTGVALSAARANPLAEAATAYAIALSQGLPLAAEAVPVGATLSDKAKDAWQCVHLTYQLALATAHHDEQTAQAITQQLGQFGKCDKKWVTETVEQFLRHFPNNQSSIPYVPNVDNVLPIDLPAQATIAVIGDWGTGGDAANNLLAQVARKEPDLVIHLGDIYYSGTPEECQHFFTNIRAVLGHRMPVLTLAGNHDMYSGGAGYYQLIEDLEQRASYFCLRNAAWQILAMDTGFNDFDPFQVSTNVTSLRDDESEWHLDKIQNPGGRKTVLLSHHPLFSAFEPIGGAAVNAHLLETFQDVLGNIAVWLWGHEHRLAIYAPHLGLARGRCLGCSAIPVSVEDGFFEPEYDDVPLLKDPDNGDQPVQLGDNGTLYNRAYAILKFDGAAASIAYYQDSDEVKPLLTETIPE
jgi:Calcineurin-like phosphoesterase